MTDSCSGRWGIFIETIWELKADVWSIPAGHLTTAELSLPVTAEWRSALLEALLPSADESVFRAEMASLYREERFRGALCESMEENALVFSTACTWGRLMLITVMLSTVTCFDAEGLMWIVHFLEPFYSFA